MMNWQRLGEDMPRIVQALQDMMIKDGIPAMTELKLEGLAWPSVSIGFATKDGEKFKVTLSIAEGDGDDAVQ